MKEKGANYLKNYVALSSIGIMFVACVVIGYVIGYYLDKFLGTSPYLMLIFTVFGMIAGFLELMKVAKQMNKK